MKKYLLFILVASCFVGGTAYAIVLLSGTAGITLADGEFRTDGTGNAGTVTYADVLIDDSNILTGDFWIQTIGTGTFAPGARIQYTGTGNPTLDCWSVIGTATSNAGNIELDGPDTQLAYNPISQNLEGYGWNNGIGNVPFGVGNCADDIVTPGAAFIGKVKIIGNAGGKTLFSTIYDQGPKFDTSLFNSLLQRIRKNVGVLSRNLSSIQKNETFSTTNTTLNKLFYVNSDSATRVLRYQNIRSAYNALDVQGLIIIGGDLYIDEDIFNTTGIPKGIIVLQNNNGVGGNVYINEDVQRIQSTIFAEGTIYSGESSSVLYNDSSQELLGLPNSQLYVEGSLISRNTIGGASISKVEVVCPYNKECDFERAIKYDFNYFRVYDGEDSTRAYENNSLDDYSVIIEYDSRVVSNPPPGFE